MTVALIFIDVQRNMLEGESAIPGTDEITPALEALLTRARAERATVVHVLNDGPAGAPDEPHTEGWEPVFPSAPGEFVVRKDVPDTFAANPDLADELRERGVDRLVVAGMQSDFCVEATSRGALRHGFGVLLASGAHATYDTDVPATDVSAAIEAELGEAGVSVRPAPAIPFA
jgi:nicotinamidase-related amidase